MLYLHSEDIRKIKIVWQKMAGIICEATRVMKTQDYAQPIKPYLRYRDLKNRIIAMPAYLGNTFNVAGIKWIASFPKNIDRGIPRAHSLTVLNDADNGIPVCVINSAILSQIRTAAVSAAVTKEYLKLQSGKKGLKAGITGFGPIGRMHLDMLLQLFEDDIDTIFIYDVRKPAADTLPASKKTKIVIADAYTDFFSQSDIFITCTTSGSGYISQAPKKGSLQLNVSLRDYQPQFLQHVDLVIVDDWEEVCRENTDVEVMHREAGLTKEQTITITEFLHNNMPGPGKGDTIMFNPMGLGIFDIAICSYFMKHSLEHGIGINLPD